MPVDFAFGKQGLSLAIPEGGPRYRTLEARWAKPVGDPLAAIEDGLDRPYGDATIPNLVAELGAKTAAISVCDITRPAPNRLTLPPLLRRLAAAGIPNENVTIVIATGLHRPATEAEIHEIVGEETARTCRIVNHHARVKGEQRYLGQTKSGTPVYVDERFVGADLHITLGFIEPHLMAGFSGGRKLIAPGVAGEDTIKRLHSPHFMRDPRAVEGSIEDNPLHAELLEIAAIAGHHFALDVVLAKGKKIAAVFAGDPRVSHPAGIQFVRESMIEWLPQPAGAVITTSAGYPLDLTFYQAVKGITAASHIVKPGGTILLMAECSEGPGAAEFSQMLRESPDPGQFLEKLNGAPVTVDQWQMEKFALAVQRNQIWFYTPGLPQEYHKNLWGKSFSNPQEAVDQLMASVPKQEEVAVIPEGPYVLARVQPNLG